MLNKFIKWMNEFRASILFGGNGEGVSKATLHAPTIALNGDTITIMNSADNGDFAQAYDIYCNGVYAIRTTSTTYDLSTITGLPTGTDSFTVRAVGYGMNDSSDSNAVSYEVINYFICSDDDEFIDADENEFISA